MNSEWTPRIRGTEFGTVDVEELGPAEVIGEDQARELGREEDYYFAYDNWRDWQDSEAEFHKEMEQNAGAYLDTSPDPDV